MRKTFVISLFAALFTTSFTTLAAPVEFIGGDSVQTRSNGQYLSLNSRSVESLVGNRSGDGSVRHGDFLNSYIARDFPPDQIAREILQDHEEQFLQVRGKGGKKTSETVGQGPYTMDKDDYHRNVKPVIQSHFAQNDPNNHMNGNNPNYDIDRKGNVQANPQNGGSGSGYVAKMKDIFPNSKRSFGEILEVRGKEPKPVNGIWGQGKYKENLSNQNSNIRPALQSDFGTIDP